MVRFHLIGEFAPGEVIVEAVPDTRPCLPEVEALIDAAWSEAARRPGVHLFDGPMCRLESFRAEGSHLTLQLSPTSYKPFLGTNLSHPELADRFGPVILGNPVGVSSLLQTSDDVLLLGRRNDSVAYYPGRIHPFAGSLEPQDADVFAAVRRELEEELSLADGDLSHMTCAGIAEDARIRQPELIFRVRTSRSRAQIESSLDETEHSAIFALPATRTALEAALAEPLLTPIATAALLLWGRAQFGADWFAGSTPSPPWGRGRG